MEEQLFVRIRGHVQGPYELERLRALVRRGQLSRMHEVSANGSVWKPASSYPELFVAPTTIATPVRTDSHASTKLDDGDIGLESPQPSRSSRWHYAQKNMQLGPVSFEDLRSMIASGGLSASDLVWTDGMKDWMPASSVSGLLPVNSQHTLANNGTSPSIDRDVLRTFTDSRPWTTFIGTFMWLVGSLGVIFGIAGVILGARWNEASIIASGGFLILYGSVFIWGGQLLLGYCRAISTLLQEKSSQRLDETLRSLRRFWIYLSIILIVVLVNVSALAIWAFSIGVSLSGR